MDQYIVDETARLVYLKVDVGTSGIAATSVFLGHDDQSELIQESEPFSGGDIPFFKVGKNKLLKSTDLNIRTAIDLSGIPEDKWQAEIDNVLTVISTLKGGKEVGELEFKMKVYEVDSSDLPAVFVDKKIELR